MIAHTISGTATGGAQLEGVVDDIIKIVNKVPQHLADITVIIDKAGQYLPTIARIAEDPALPALVERIKQLRALEERAAAKRIPGASPAAAAAVTKGIGLDKLIKPLDLAIYVRERPWVPYAVVGGSVSLLLVLGFVVGRVSKRR